MCRHACAPSFRCRRGVVISCCSRAGCVTRCRRPAMPASVCRSVSITAGCPNRVAGVETAMRRLLSLFGVIFAGPAWADCPMDLGRGTGWVIFSAHYMISFRPDPMRVEIGEPVALILNVCTKDSEAAELVGVTAQLVEGQPAESKGPSQQLRIV